MHPTTQQEGFVLSPRLKADTSLIMDLRLSTVLLMNDARYPWVILVPRIANAEEIFNLGRAQQTLLTEETSAIASALNTIHAPTKVNVAALGNIVRQLHIHIVARFDGDPAWPGPIWGQGDAIPYDETKPYNVEKLRETIESVMRQK